MPVITLPDGSQRSFPNPVTVTEVAQSIGAGLARAALAGKVDGVLVDTSHLIAADAKLAIVTDKDADGLDLIRHSTAHLLALRISRGGTNPAPDGEQGSLVSGSPPAGIGEPGVYVAHSRGCGP